MWKNFKSAKIWELKQESPKEKFTWKAVIKWIVVIICLWIVILCWKYLVQWGKIALWLLWKTTINTVSKSLWEEMIRDWSGNVNILIIWIGWERHQWWFLADTTIVASRSPEKWAVTMISIPRDLYVAWSWYAWRINWLFARWHSKWWTIGSWAEVLIQKVQQIVWLEIPYYMVADFQWFKEVVDTLWWIELYVPETIHDTTYPDNNLWYQTFHISAWQQVLDGETALKYARSRHTTSDFSRSQRQQEIIKAVLAKALQRENITSVSKLKSYYDTYTRMITTNISSKEVIWMVKYAYMFKNMFSFWFNTYCTYSSYKLTDAACFLYNGNRESFNGAAVIIPNGANAWNVSFYEYTQNFANMVSHNQWYLIEWARIMIRNGIDKSYAQSMRKSPTWWANKIAVKLKKYWFILAGTENSDETILQTTAITYGDEYPETIETLKKFIPVNVVKTWQILTEWTWEDIVDQDLWYDIELILWNDFIDYINETPFSYEK